MRGQVGLEATYSKTYVPEKPQNLIILYCLIASLHRSLSRLLKGKASRDTTMTGPPSYMEEVL